MSEATDILLDSNYDTAVVGGDISVGNADYQHQAVLLKASEGEIKQLPVTGVGIELYLNSENPALLIRKIRNQFVKDGMQVSSVNISSLGKLEINAKYL